MPRREGDDELLRPQVGRTLQDVMWEELVECINKLMEDRLEGTIEWESEDRARCQGRAEGVAWCIAVLTQSPRPVNINAVKERAMEMWETQQS